MKCPRCQSDLAEVRTTYTPTTKHVAQPCGCKLSAMEAYATAEAPKPSPARQRLIDKRTKANDPISTRGDEPGPR